MALHIDFETRSRVNLTVAGAYNYASDPSTSVLCMGYALGDEAPEIWLPHEQVFPCHIRDYIEDGGDIYAHNAAFERLIFDFIIYPDFDVPERISLEQWVCTAAMARASGLPGALADVARVLGGDQKDTRGGELIRLLSLPIDARQSRKEFYFEGEEFRSDTDLLEEMYEYCAQDVITERSVAKQLRMLNDQERAEYVVNEKINDRGLKVDRAVAVAAVGYAKAEKAEADAEISELTDGEVKSTGSIKLTQYVYNFLPIENKDLMWKHVRGQEAKLSLDKSIQDAILELPHQGLATDLVETKKRASKSSVSKFQAMINAADPEDDRVRGAYIFNGAATTGRYTARMVQPHNFPRDCAKDPEAVRSAMIHGAPLDNVMRTLSSMIRPSIIADEGKVFVGGDWSSIEARVLPWAADDDRAQERLDVFASGKDIYVETANKFGGSRQEGKTMELACGFAGGVGAFQTMARATGVQVTDDRADELKNIWRRDNPWAQPFWNKLEESAHKAIRNPGVEYEAGRVTYIYYGPKGGGGALYCRLPSGRHLGYPQAKLVVEDGRFGPQTTLTAIKANLRPKVGAPWPRNRLWKGLLAENITQAIAADVLRATQVHVEISLPGAQVGDTHDELLLEVNQEDKDVAWAALERIMETTPFWAKGLPLAAELWSGTRYQK